ERRRSAGTPITTASTARASAPAPNRRAISGQPIDLCRAGSSRSPAHVVESDRPRGSPSLLPSAKPLHDPVQQLSRTVDVNEVAGSVDRVDTTARRLEPPDVVVGDVVGRAAADDVDAGLPASFDRGPQVLHADLRIRPRDR